jgi:hypothetical protein
MVPRQCSPLLLVELTIQSTQVSALRSDFSMDFEEIISIETNLSSCLETLLVGFFQYEIATDFLPSDTALA